MLKYIKILCILSLLTFMSCSEETADVQTKVRKNKIDSVRSESTTIKRVIDGDTFETDKGERIRLLGIDTPEKFSSNKMSSDAERSGLTEDEIKSLGEISSHYADSLMKGKKVFLLSDPLNDDTDRYGRLLRYIFTEDGVMYNLKIISDGYAYAYTKFPIITNKMFISAENDARKNNRGLWSDESFKKLKEQQ